MGAKGVRLCGHTMVRAVTPGWFVCRACKVIAGCPGCVVVPEAVRVHLCGEHRHFAAVNGMAERTIWATNESAR